MMIPRTPGKYIFTDDMYEITGEGGHREKACQDFVCFVMEWKELADKMAKTYVEEISEVGMEDTIQRVLKAKREMHEYAQDRMKEIALRPELGGSFPSNEEKNQITAHINYIRAEGWEKYVEESKKRAYFDKMGTVEPSEQEDDSKPMNVMLDGNLMLGSRDIQA